MNVISDYLNFELLLKDLRKIVTGMDEQLYWWLDGHLQTLETCYRPLCAQGISKMRA